MDTMGRLNLTALLLAPVLVAFVLVLMSVENPFSIAFAAILILSQVPMIRWILALNVRQPARIGSARLRRFPKA
jgi:hypothetical protein